MKFAPMNYHYLRYPIKKFLDKVERSPFNSIDLYCSAPQLNLFDYPLSRLIELKKEIKEHRLSVMAMTPENCVYGNDPDNITTTTPDVVTTPTYPVQIHKLIKDQQNSYLAGAIFRLYRSEEDANNNQNAIAVTGSNGTYTVDPVQVGDNKMYDMESIGDGTTVGTGMNLKLNGLAEGSYWLVETQAPDGYNKLTAPVKITITKSDTTNVDDWTIKQNDGVVDDKIIDIENTTGTLLPETGGMGTVIFTVIAVVMILGIAVSFVISRRKRA